MYYFSECLKQQNETQDNSQVDNSITAKFCYKDITTGKLNENFIILT